MALGVIVCNHMIEIARLKNKIDSLIQKMNDDNAENTDAVPHRRRRRRRKRKEYIEQQEFKPECTE